MGRELKRRFLAAGSIDVSATGSFDYFGTAEDVASLYGVMVDWFLLPEVIAAKTRCGLATHEEFERWGLKIDQWRNSSGAVRGMAFGEAIAVKV